MSNSKIHKQSRVLWILLLGVQGVLLVICLAFTAVLKVSEPSVKSTLTDQGTCTAEARKADAPGVKVSTGLLARCEFLERRTVALERVNDKLSGTIETGVLVVMGLLLAFIVIEIAILMRGKRAN